MRFWRRSANGRTAPWRRVIRLFSSMRCGSKSATKAQVAQQGGLYCAGRPGGRHKGHSGPLDRKHRSAKFWLRVMNELKNRGVGDVLIAVVDGLKGFPEAINAVFPHTI